MKQFRLVDNVLGWVVFAIAAFVYCSTMEPTASYWDCPEFIDTAANLQIGHPPGAPFFMLTGNLFTQFAGDASHVAMMINMMSALLSALTILFLFWSITHLTRKLILKDWGELTTSKLISIEASGLVGALIYTFSDTFWFSAVEGEVYAYSSAFTAIVFWLILKWEDHADEPHADRWLVLIAYMTGLSIGVHLLNLLCIPAIVLVYCYKKFPQIETKGSLLALIVSFLIVGGVLYGVVPGIVTVGGWFELFFTNTLGCPFNTGTILYILLLLGTMCWSIWETYTDRSRKRSNISFVVTIALLGVPFYGYGWSAALIGVVVLALLWFVLNLDVKKAQTKTALVTSRVMNTALLCMLMLVIGYSSYAITVIRSTANTPMDQNSPEDIFTLGNYLARDQYGDSPLFYGPAYTSQVEFDVDGNICRPRSDKGRPVYERQEKKSADEKDHYYVSNYKTRYIYAQNMLFPRMHDPKHAAAYEAWEGGVKGYQVPYDRCGEMVSVKMPTMLENLHFFLSYQCNFMYWRYFMWNFAGRQNDLLSAGELNKGNWLTGIPFIDNWRLGDQSLLPDTLKNNKGHNVFYCLPLLLGLIGLFWQAYRGKRGIRQFWVVFFLFFMTGLAIVLYLNQTPNQVRERDYAYAGSFYAFAIWCGMGVAALIDQLKKRLSKVNDVVLAAVVALACVLVPLQMASQTWDDHDRSGRYMCRDFGRNYLVTLQDQGNPIIFTNGDNDTFPLWYNQDVEGERTDARVCNLSYLQTDWYIDQMRRPAYDSPSVPITWSKLDYCTGTNEYVEITPEAKEDILACMEAQPELARELLGENPFELKNVLKIWVRQDYDDETFDKLKALLKLPMDTPKRSLHFIPTDTLYMTTDVEAVKRSGMLIAADSIPEKMTISLDNRKALYKSDLMMLEIISQCNWERPVYVATTVGADNFMNLGDNFVQEGLANRITPFTTNTKYATDFDVEKVYDAVMNRYRWGGLEKPGLYLDETITRMCFTHRHLFVRLINELIEQEDFERAKKALDKQDKMIPSYNVPLTYMSGANDLARAYATVGNKKKAREYAEGVLTDASQYVQWYLSLDDDKFLYYKRETMQQFYMMQAAIDVIQEYVDEELGAEYNGKLNELYTNFVSRGGLDR